MKTDTVGLFSSFYFWKVDIGTLESLLPQPRGMLNGFILYKPPQTLFSEGVELLTELPSGVTKAEFTARLTNAAIILHLILVS